MMMMMEVWWLLRTIDCVDDADDDGAASRWMMMRAMPAWRSRSRRWELIVYVRSSMRRDSTVRRWIEIVESELVELVAEVAELVEVEVRQAREEQLVEELVVILDSTTCRLGSRRRS